MQFYIPCIGVSTLEYFLYSILWLVIWGPVQSGFFTSKSGNRNRSWTDPYIEWTQPDQVGPVLISPVALKRLVQTGFLM